MHGAAAHRVQREAISEHAVIGAGVALPQASP
jgi:hypothetical protein